METVNTEAAKKFDKDFERNCVLNERIHINSTLDALSMGKIETYVDNIIQNAIAESVSGLAGKRILCVGVVALDHIAIVERYPDEDEEIIAKEYFTSRGGNAANSATVLGLLGANTEFLGPVVRNKDFDFIVSDFKDNNVHSDNIVALDPAKHKPPVTFIWINEKTGTRTIVADFKNLTELRASDFARLDLSKYMWIHFEGRENVNEICKMIAIIDKFNENNDDVNRIKVSVEIEFPPSVSPNLQELFGKADFVFISKDYGRAMGYNSKEETVEGLLKKCKTGATIICPWGEDGAAAMRNEVVTSTAFPPDWVIDTIGAGDTFIAGTIFSICQRMSLEKAIGFGCTVAGAKCGMRGFSGLKKFKTS